MKAVEATMGMARRVMSRSAMSMVRTILGCGDIGGVGGRR